MYICVMCNIKFFPIPTFEGFYESSKCGKIRSIANKNRYRPNQKGRILKQHISKYGYCQVTLSINGIYSLKRVNRLIAQTFIPNPENKPCVNHKNGVKTDNSVQNLEWVTYSENEIHSYKKLNKNIKGNVKKYKNGINTKSKKIYCIENGIIFNSIKEAAKILKLYRSSITAQIKGRLKKTGGFSFIFI